MSEELLDSQPPWPPHSNITEVCIRADTSIYDDFLYAALPYYSQSHAGRTCIVLSIR